MTELIGQTSSGRVHVVRHVFEPNLPFAELIEDFTGPNEGSRFLLRSSKEVYVDTAIYTRGGYREQDEYVLQEVERAKQYPFIIGRAGMKLLVAKSSHPSHAPRPPTYRLAFLPADTKAFQKLESTLDVYPSVLSQTKEAAASGGGEEKEATKKTVAINHYLYIDFPAAVALAYKDRAEAESAFKQEIINRLPQRMFSATIAGLRAQAAPFRYIPDVPKDN